MKVDPFRYCDVRGVYPGEVNGALFTRLGTAIARRCGKGETVLVGRDCRASSSGLMRALIDGITSTGSDVADGGVAPTPVLYHGKRTLGVRFAACVTASHNPSQYNGLKLLPPDHGCIPEEMVQLRTVTHAAEEALPAGAVGAVDLHGPYREWIGVRWRSELSAIGKHVVLDPGGGAWSGLAIPVFERAGLKACAIHDEASGDFEHRSPDCTASSALAALGKAVGAGNAAAGIAWDGDGDRMAMCDETGRPISSDQLALLLIPRLLARHPGEKILVDIKMSRKVAAAIAGAGGRAIVERSAHCLLERTMLRQRCLFGCEYSGHYFFRELHGADDGMFAALLACSMLLGGERPLSEAVDLLPPLHITPDLRIPGGEEQFRDIRERLTAEFRHARLDYLDGLRIDLEESWLLVRQSVSENRITWRVEGDDARALHSMLERLGRVLPEYRDQLSIPRTTFA